MASREELFLLNIRKKGPQNARNKYAVLAKASPPEFTVHVHAWRHLVAAVRRGSHGTRGQHCAPEQHQLERPACVDCTAGVEPGLGGPAYDIDWSHA